jgi:hypothetical protein
VRAEYPVTQTVMLAKPSLLLVCRLIREEEEPRVTPNGQMCHDSHKEGSTSRVGVPTNTFCKFGGHHTVKMSLLSARNATRGIQTAGNLQENFQTRIFKSFIFSIYLLLKNERRLMR